MSDNSKKDPQDSSSPDNGACYQFNYWNEYVREITGESGVAIFLSDSQPLDPSTDKFTIGILDTGVSLPTVYTQGSFLFDSHGTLLTHVLNEPLSLTCNHVISAGDNGIDGKISKPVTVCNAQESELVVELAIPDGVSEAEILEAIQRLSLDANAFHRSLGGDGLKIKQLRIDAEVASEVSIG